MGNISPPQTLGSSEPVPLTFLYRSAVNLQIVFYSDAEGMTPIPASGGGTATLTYTRQSAAFEGPTTRAVRIPLPESNFDGGSMADVPGATLVAAGLGGGAASIIVRATSVSGPAGPPVALSYRIHADAETRGGS